MSLGPLMLDLEGAVLADDESELLADPRVGGVILFTRNYESPEQLTKLCAEIHAIRSPHLIIGVDQEGGRVQRFRHGFTELPPMTQYGKRYEEDSEAAQQEARSGGWLIAAELLACGVDFSFAPVLDLNYGHSSVIGDRSFNRDPQAVADLAHAWMSGMRSAGMQGAVGKHFPGHGWVKADSHVAVPIDSRLFADLQMADLIPFQQMVDYGLEGIMSAHIYYSQIDPKFPAGFSRFWLQEILRGELNFTGAIFSDDLTMEGAATFGNYAQRAAAALEAGCDMVLVCNHRDAAIEVLRSLPKEDDPVRTARLTRFHGKSKMTREQLLNSPEWAAAHKLAESLLGIHTEEMEV